MYSCIVIFIFKLIYILNWVVYIFTWDCACWLQYIILYASNFPINRTEKWLIYAEKSNNDFIENTWIYRHRTVNLTIC